MIDMPERLEMIRYLTMVLDDERRSQPERLDQAEVRTEDAGIVVQFRRPRHTKILLPATWLSGRSNSMQLGMALGGFKLAVLLRKLDEIPEDLPPLPAEVKPAIKITTDDRQHGLDMALRACFGGQERTTEQIVTMADAFARYLAGERPGEMP